MKRRWSAGAAVGAALALAGAAALAAPPDPDPSFAQAGRLAEPTAGLLGRTGTPIVEAVPDGRVVVVQTVVVAARNGVFGGIDDTRIRVRRLLADGSPDAGFAGGRELEFSVRGGDRATHALALPDGRLLVALATAEACENNVGLPGCTTLRSALVRVNADGTRDGGFGAGGVAYDEASFEPTALALAPDGRILMAGNVSVGRARIWGSTLVRFSAEGIRDPGFGSAGVARSRCAAVLRELRIRGDGRLVWAGTEDAFYPDPAASPGVCVESLSADGAPDATFEPRFHPIGVNIDRLRIDVSDPFWVRVLAGAVDTGGSNGVVLVQVLAAGLLAPTPPPRRIVPAPDFRMRDALVDPLGRWTVLGESRADGASLAAPAWLRLDRSGQPDTGFAPGGYAITGRAGDAPRSLARDASGRLLAGALGVLGAPVPDATRDATVVLRFAGNRVQPTSAVEFFNTPLAHYFVTAGPGEIAGIDAGAAGPGWSRTGLSFGVWIPETGVRDDARPVCRFYGTPGRGPNSHFYTFVGPECEAVQRDPGWTIEGIAFHAVPTVAGRCPAGTVPVHRLYNNRFAFNDSNHRYTTDPAVVAAMQARGWTLEGIAFCGG